MKLMLFSKKVCPKHSEFADQKISQVRLGKISRYLRRTFSHQKGKMGNTRWQLANFDNFWLRAVFFTPKVAFWKAWMKNKVFGNQIKEEKLEIFASVPYRSIRGEGKERICERYRQKEVKLENLRDFQQIQVKFYQLFATVLRWSLEKFEEKIFSHDRVIFWQQLCNWWTHQDWVRL